MCAECDGVESEAGADEAWAGDTASTCFGEKSLADGEAISGLLLTDELTAIGELTLAIKLAGDIATGVITNIIGVSCHWVIKAGVDMSSV